MRPTVVASANANASAGVGGGGGGGNAPNTNPSTGTNGVNIPISHEYGNEGHFAPPSAGYYQGGNAPNYGSPHQQQQYHHPQQQPQQQHSHQQMPAHFQQGFGFQPDMDMDMDMDMFPRSRLGRMHHDPFANFGNARKRTNVTNEPHSMDADGFSRYFDDAADFGFPQFNSLGRRRATDHMGRDDDFFNRLPSEFRQYIPETFGHRRAGSGSGSGGNMPPPQQQQQQPQANMASQQQPQGQYYQNFAGAAPPSNNNIPQSPSKKLCDAAIQTEDPTGQGANADVVDSSGSASVHDNLKQHGLRNTVDMGVKSALESEQHGPRAHSAPPNEQQLPANGKHQTPPPQAGHAQFATQTSPHVQSAPAAGQQPQFQKAYYAPQQQAHPQQRQQSPTPQPQQPQTPGGSYIRTIPIFVEGRSEPIINHKEIPNQHSAPGTATATAKAHASAPQQQQQQQPQFHQQPPQQQPQQHRPTPLNTQPQQMQAQPQQHTAAVGAMPPPQTPHTLDSISKIQDIQRDVLDLMSCVEDFTGTREDREYMFLDEMLTRNLLKLDTIDTNGKDSIRLARKEAIKCIQASINVLEAKAEENARKAQAGADSEAPTQSMEAAESDATQAAAVADATETADGTAQKSASKGEVSQAKETETVAVAKTPSEPQLADAKKLQEPIPLPPPEGMQVNANAVVAIAAAPAADKQQPAEEQTSQATAALALAPAPIEAAASSNNESK